MSYLTGQIQFVQELESLVLDQAEWSQKTFGSDGERGPVGALLHLAKEAQEAADSPGDISEYADCFLLLIDATRRAGWKLGDIVDAAAKKMKINKQREWPKPIPNEPVEHIKQSQK